MSYPAPTATPFPRPAGHAPAARAAAANPYAAQANRYREAELTSASPGQLVVMLYDRMLLTLRRARVALDAGDIEGRTENILKVTDMVTELKLSLDHEAGGAISAQLDALYAFMLRELFDANRHQDAARLEAVTRIAGELREAFAGAQAQLAGQGPAGGPAGTPAAGVATLRRG